MGLASTLSTALTGLTAAETTIDVVGNNLANSNTVGFKASEASFATQFLHTLSLGAAPTENTGGTNPRQIGLGTMVADITPNFTQGTIEISSNATDLAIQGDGFFIVEDQGGQRLYTRNGIFKFNAQNEMVTITGNRLLGYGVDDNFQLERTILTPVTIPLGSTAVAQATENAYLQGTLSPTGDLADTAEIIQTTPLGDSLYAPPDTSGVTLRAAPAKPDLTTNPTTFTPGAGGNLSAGDYQYKIVLYDPTTGTEGIPSDASAAVTCAANDRVVIGDFPPNTDPDSIYSEYRIYRTTIANPNTYYLVGSDTIANLEVPGATFLDTVSDTDLEAAGQQLNEALLNYSYSYYITYVDAAGNESRPEPPPLGPYQTVDGRIQLRDLPVPGPGDHPGEGWTGRRIYRNTAGQSDTFFLVAEINNIDPNLTYTDGTSDAVLETHAEIDLDGKKITSGTFLVDVQRRDGTVYEQVFEEGTLEFTGRKGGRSLATREFQITSTTTVAELISFMEEALGIQATGDDPVNPIPGSQYPTPPPDRVNPGGSVTTDGRIQLVGNNGADNAIDVGLSGMQMVTTSGTTQTVNMPWASIQSAVGESAVADFLAYDSLGIPISVRVTAVLEARDSTSTTYRWFADSPDNDPTSGAEISVGTGLITFDGEGNFVSASQSTVSIDRRNVSSTTPLEFDLDFSQLSGLAAESSSLAVSRQDGSAPGVLTSFIVGEDGTIRGVFSNGITRDLGQLQLARFANPAGLEQRGENLFAEGVNSGLPVQSDPGQQGIGTLIAGAVELSNTDIGGNLIDLILASTMYRGNTRVISTAQQMIDELLALRR